MVLIIGAGISGLSAGRVLKEKCIIIEKDNRIGGLSSPYRSNQFWFDHGGHYFHFHNKEHIKVFLEKICHFREYRRKSRIFLQNCFIPFPIQYHLAYLPPVLRRKTIGDLSGTAQAGNKNLHEQLVKRFGRTLFEIFFSPFLTKYYGKNLDELTAGMDKGSIPMPSREVMLQSAIRKKRFQIGYNPVFYYPQKSLNDFFSTYQKDIRHLIQLNEKVISIDIEKRQVTTTGNEYHYEYLINTMPLKSLLKIIKQKNPQSYHHRLVHISTQVINVVLKKKKKRFHWVYLPERRFPFYRVGFYPYRGLPVCYLEKTLPPEQPGSNDVPFADVIHTLKMLDIIDDRQDITHLDNKYIPVSYILFDHDWHRTVPRILSLLEKKQIFSIGRYGSWNYTSMSDDVDVALKTGSHILSSLK